MLERIKSFLIKHDLQDKTVIVGFSGGYDSMCLLDLLSKVRNDEQFFDLTIIAAHFNHNWRGEEALREQEVCRLFATSKGFEFVTKTAQGENDLKISPYIADVVCEFLEEKLNR